MATYMPLQDLQLTIVGECTSSIQETVSECEHEIVCPTKTLILEDYENRIVHPCYELKTTPRGYCVIIDNMENNTFGGDKNNKQLTRCLEESLAFHVEHFTKLNTKSIHRLLEKLSEVNHNDYSCLMVIVLGRGRNHFLYGYDNEVIEFSEIMSYFKPEICTTLRDTPKLFLFQTFGKESESVKNRPQIPHPELTDSYQIFCELLHPANTSFVHKFFEEIESRGQCVEATFDHVSSMLSRSVDVSVTYV